MATIRDVARLAGVSPSTASRALNNNGQISAKTTAKVKAAMKKLNYSPNYAARNLANRDSNTVAVVLPVRPESVGNNPFFMQILQGICATCNTQGYLVSLATGKTEEELLKNIQNLIRLGNVKLFIMAFANENDEIMDFLEKQEGVKCVVIGHPAANEKVRYVDNDNYKAAVDAADYLLDQGKTGIGYVYTDLNEMVQLDRYQGYWQTMAKHGRPYAKLNLGEHEDDEDGVNLAKLKEFLRTHPQINSFVACDDVVGTRLQQLLVRLRLDPSSYSLVSFNNSVFARLAHPALTSMELFPKLLGAESAMLAIEGKNNAADDDKRRIIVPHKLVERNRSSEQD